MTNQERVFVILMAQDCTIEGRDRAELLALEVYPRREGEVARMRTWVGTEDSYPGHGVFLGALAVVSAISAEAAIARFRASAEFDPEVLRADDYLVGSPADPRRG